MAMTLGAFKITIRNIKVNFSSHRITLKYTNSIKVMHLKQSLFNRLQSNGLSRRLIGIRFPDQIVMHGFCNERYCCWGQVTQKEHQIKSRVSSQLRKLAASNTNKKPIKAPKTRYIPLPTIRKAGLPPSKRGST